MSSEDRLLKAVQAIAISPDDANELVESYYRKARAKGVTDEREAVAEAIVKRYARMAAGVGGSTALVGVVPGLGTVAAAIGGAVADAAASMKLQVDMTMCLAAAYGYDLTSEDVRHLTLLIAAGGALERSGEQAAVRIASQAGVKLLRHHLRGATLQAVKVAFRKLGLVFTRKALEKSIPFGIGVVLGGGANYALTRYVGSVAQRWFRIDAANGDQDTETV